MSTDDFLRHNYLKRVEAERREADKYAEPALGKAERALTGHSSWLRPIRPDAPR